MAGLNAEAAVSIEVKYKNQMHRVVDVRRNQPVIEVEGKRRTLSRAQIGMRRDGGITFEGGYFELKDRRIRSQSLISSSTGGEFNSRLFFNAKIKTSVDLENCILVIELNPAFGNSRIVLAELPNFEANKWTKVYFSVPTNKSLGGGKAKHYIFSDGHQILPKRQYNQFRQRQARVNVSGPQRQDRPPQVVTTFNPGFPKALIGVIAEGSVRLEYTIGMGGKAQNIKVLQSTHELLEQPAIEAITKSTYQSAIKQGKPVSTRLRQTVSFTASKKKVN